MAHLVLTVAGSDRSGLVETLATTVAAHGGNWRRGELAEMSGTFAGVVLVDVPDDHRDALTADLEGLRGLLAVTPFDAPDTAAPTGERVTFTVLGNDHVGIVRDVTRALQTHGLSIDALSSRTRPAPMAGGELFEATVTAHAKSTGAVSAAVSALEQLAAEIQVEVTVA